MSVQLLAEHHLEFLSLIGGCTGSSESTLVGMSHCLRSHGVAHMYFTLVYIEMHCSRPVVPILAIAQTAISEDTNILMLVRANTEQLNLI